MSKNNMFNQKLEQIGGENIVDGITLKSEDKEKINSIIKEAKENGKMTYGDLATKLNDVNPEEMDSVFDAFEEIGVDLLPDDFEEEPDLEDLKV